MFKEEKKEINSWIRYTLGWVIIIIAIFSVLNYIGIIGSTVVERKVFENSYQKVSADNKAERIYSAQLAEVNSMLDETDIDSDTRQDLRRQAALLRVQLNSIR